MEEIRFGIVGTGRIASMFAAGCALTPGVRAAGVSSRSLENGRRFAAENNVERVYCGVQELAASPEIDIVYVAVPHPAHAECCMAALRGGKHVLCEKPLATKKADAEKLFQQAKARGLFLMEGMWSRFLPTSAKALEWVRSGRIGKLTFIDGIFSFAVDAQSPKPRVVDPKLGGGSMYDLGVYTVEMASFYAGANPLEWSGYAAAYCPGTDAAAVMALRYPGDVLATLRTGITCQAPAMMTLQGDKGRIELPRFFSACEARLYEGDTLAERFCEDCNHPGGFRWQISAVRECVLAGAVECSVVPAADTIATAGVLEDMMRRFFPTLYGQPEQGAVQ